MSNFATFLEKNILWIDIVLFLLIGIIFIVLLLFNNFYLQFLTSTLLIVIGSLQLFLPHLQPFLNDLKLILPKEAIDDENYRNIVNAVLGNKLVLEIIFFSLVFSIVLLIDTIIYLVFIRRKYDTRYSLKNWKSNLWKIVYLVFLVFIFANIFSVFSILYPKIRKKSVFNKMIVETKLNEWIKRKNRYNFFFLIIFKAWTHKEEFEKTEAILTETINDIEKTEDTEEQKEIVINFIKKIRKDAKNTYKEIKEIEEFEGIKLEKILDSDQPLIKEKKEVDKFLKVLKENYQELSDKTNFLSEKDKTNIEKLMKNIND